MRLALITVLSLLSLWAYPQGGTTQVKASAVTMQSGTLQTALDVVDARMAPEYRLGVRQGDIAGIVSNYFADTVTLLLRNTLTSYTFPFTTNSIIFGPNSSLSIPQLTARDVYMNSGWFSHLNSTGTITTSWAYLYGANAITNVVMRNLTVTSGRLPVHQAIGDLDCVSLRTDLLGLGLTTASSNATIVDAGMVFTGDVYIPSDAEELSLFTEPRLILNVNSNTISYNYDPLWVLRTASGPKLYAGRYQAVWRTSDGSTLATATLESRWAIPIARLGPPGLIFSVFASNSVPVSLTVTNYSVKVYLSPMLKASRTITLGVAGDSLVDPLPDEELPPLVFPPFPTYPTWHYIDSTTGQVWGCSESNAVSYQLTNGIIGCPGTPYNIPGINLSWGSYEKNPWTPSSLARHRGIYLAYVASNPLNPQLAVTWWPAGSLTVSSYREEAASIPMVEGLFGLQKVVGGDVQSKKIITQYMGRFNGGFRAVASTYTDVIYWRVYYYEWYNNEPGFYGNEIEGKRYRPFTTDYSVTAAIPICIYADGPTAYWISNDPSSPGYWGAATTFTVTTNGTIAQATTSGTGNYNDANHGIGLPGKLGSIWLGGWEVPSIGPPVFIRSSPNAWLSTTWSQRFNTWRYPSGNVIISDSNGNIVKTFYANNGRYTLYGPYDSGCQGWFAVVYDSFLDTYEIHGTEPANLAAALHPPGRTRVESISFVQGSGYVDYTVNYEPQLY